MNKLEKLVVESVRKYADVSVNMLMCNYFFYQPKVTEQLKNRLKETRQKK